MSNIFANPGLKGNPHFTDVTALTDLPEVQVSAILTLAYEQRTANLIAHAQLLSPSPELTALAQTITERLGL